MMGDLFAAGEMTEQLQLLAEDPQETKGLSRLLQFEDCASAINGLFQQALAATGANAFTEFLNFVRNFRQLSVYNAMLVRVQRPGAVAVATRRQWRQLGRGVLADAIPIVILQPFGPVRFVYEFGDTVGPAIPGENASCLFADGKLDQVIYDRTRAAAEKYGIKVTETDQYGPNLAGTAAGIAIKPEWDHAQKVLPYRVKRSACTPFLRRRTGLNPVPRHRNGSAGVPGFGLAPRQSSTTRPPVKARTPERGKLRL